MRWFINSTKETAGFNDNNFQAQIDAINTRLDSQRMDLTNKTNLFGDSLHDKGIQINNILKHQGKQDERIDELEKGMEKAKELLRAAFNTITDLDNKVKALENQSVPKQYNYDAKSKTLILSSTVDQDAKPIKQIVESCVASRKRLKSTFAEPKYMLPFKVALEFRKKGMKYSDIALELNKLNFKSPYGHEFYAQLVRDLLQNKIQRNNYIDSIFKIKPIN